MSVIANILWFIFTGLESWIAWAFSGLVCYITIIGIPFGRQCFKIAKLSAWPFGTDVQIDFMAHPIANVLWIIVFGWEFAIAHVILALCWYITILGIPFGKQCFKLAMLSIAPFGAKLTD